MAYTVGSDTVLKLLELLIKLRVMPEFEQFIFTASGTYRVTFKDDIMMEVWSIRSSILSDSGPCTSQWSTPMVQRRR